MQTSSGIPPNTSHQEEEEEAKTQLDFQTFLSSLPKDKGWWASYSHKYKGFWFEAQNLKGTLAFQRHFVAQDSDILLVTPPKCGTTWLKALTFTLVNRNRYPLALIEQHPLHNNNPHDLIPFMEFMHHNHIPSDNNNILPDHSTPRLLSSHSPLVTLPESFLESKAKMVYLFRNPKDVFTSLWHFGSSLVQDNGGNFMSLEEAFDMFSRGVSPRGPFWDHVLGYWNASCQQPDKILFFKYEEMKEQPVVHLRRLARFLGFPFSEEEEASGVLEDILRFCSIDSLRNMEVNKTGKIDIVMENNPVIVLNNKRFYRKGQIGDWKNLLSPEMVDRLDSITNQKFHGSGLVL